MTDFFDKRTVTSVSCTPNANCRVLDHRESPGELGLILGNRLGDDAALAVVGNAIDANKHDAAVVQLQPKNEFPEILVLSDENSGIPRRSVEDDVVLEPSISSAIQRTWWPSLRMAVTIAASTPSSAINLIPNPVQPRHGRSRGPWLRLHTQVPRAQLRV